MRFHPLRRALCLSALLLASAATAQSGTRSVEPIPRILQDRLGVTGGTIQRMALPQSGWEPFQLRMEFKGVKRLVELEPHDLRGAGYRIVRYTDQGVVEEAAPTPTTYRGTVLGVPDSIVAVNLFRGQLSGVILLPGEVWGVQPANEGFAWLPRDAHVLYRQDQLATLENVCGLDDSARHEHDLGAVAPQQRAPQVVEIAAELEPRFLNLWGGPAGAINQATTIINGVDAIYARDVDLTYVITRLVLREGGYSTNSTAVLNQMTQLWNARGGEITRDVAQLFMGRPSGGALGIAFLGTVCTAAHYSVVWHTGALVARVAVSAHELGHSFAAPHCDGINPCWIMCSFIGGCNGNITTFAPFTINTIQSFAATRNCLN
jgi:hypothetical protein